MPEPKSSTNDRPDAELARLRREHGEMTRALEAANARVLELENARDSALDRIDWAIDSIHNVIGPS